MIWGDQLLAFYTVDRQLILRALETSGGKIREAARLDRNTLKSKIQKYKIAGEGVA
ncbi:MAG: helix-turn-helix domain-containing protein, partial [Thermoanaerobaculia bacterium]